MTRRTYSTSFSPSYLSTRPVAESGTIKICIASGLQYRFCPFSSSAEIQSGKFSHVHKTSLINSFNFHNLNSWVTLLIRANHYPTRQNSFHTLFFQPQKYTAADSGRPRPHQYPNQHHGRMDAPINPCQWVLGSPSRDIQFACPNFHSLKFCGWDYISTW